MCSSLSAQVGINTENPQGMLHVDARGDTDSSLNVSDDVVFTPDGRIGVGTLNPQARLHIVSSTPGAAIRIADGSQGWGKILTSDTVGVAKWANIAGSWYAAFRGGESLGASSGEVIDVWPPFTYASAEIYPPGTGSISIDPTGGGSIQVPYTGMYRVTITGNANTTLNPSAYLAYLAIVVNTSRLLGPTLHTPKTLGATEFGFMSLLSLNEDDEVGVDPMRPTYFSATNYLANRYTNILLHIEFVK